MSDKTTKQLSKITQETLEKFRQLGLHPSDVFYITRTIEIAILHKITLDSVKEAHENDQRPKAQET